MAKITQLSQHLVNKIAAGEVIERPASVIKELVENAIDAGATRIDISIEDGGKKLIQVSDDGGGMDKQDAELAFAPHATSKLRDEDGLFNICTMGFRGEALASIASISHAHIRTRRKEDASGWEVSSSGEEITAVTPCPAASGTTITVRDLFFNTPARRKFLKTAATEFGHITEQLARLALPHPHIAFSVRHNGRDALNLPACQSTQQRVADLFTPDMAENLITIPQRNGVTTINGLIGTPAAARSSAKWQYVFLNGRYIRDRLINHAIKEGYRGRLMPTRCPVVFIFINIATDEVDVNVHPTKIEVRFRNSNGVYGDVLAALKETLNRANLTPDISTGNFADELADSDPFGEQKEPSAAAEQNKASLREALADFFKTAPAPQPRLDFPTGGPQHHEYRPAAQIAPRRDNFTVRVPAPANMPAEPADEIYELTTPPAQRPLLQIHNTYIVSQTADGLSIVDQHALHERINYNELKRRLAEGNLTKQRMLIPQTISVTPAEAALLEEAGELLATLGFEIEPFGPGTYAIQQYPTLLARRGVEMTDFLRELIDTLREDETATAERMLEKVLAMMACKASIKAGDPLSEDEMRQLLEQAEGIDKSNACPHGRPTTLNISLKELEKSFKRI